MNEVANTQTPTERWAEYADQPVEIDKFTARLFKMANPREGFTEDVADDEKIQIIARLAMQGMKNIEATGAHSNAALMVKSGFEHLSRTNLEPEDKLRNLETIKASLLELKKGVMLVSAEDREVAQIYRQFFDSIEFTCGLLASLIEEGEAQKVEAAVSERVATVITDDSEAPKASNDN